MSNVQYSKSTCHPRALRIAISSIAPAPFQSYLYDNTAMLTQPGIRVDGERIEYTVYMYIALFMLLTRTPLQ